MATIITTLPPVVEVDIIRGSSKTLEVTITDKNNVAVNLTGATLYFTVKVDPCDLVPLILKTSASSSQIQIVDAANGIARIFLDPADTQNIDIATYSFDVWVKLSSGKHYPVLSPSALVVKIGVSVVP